MYQPKQHRVWLGSHIVVEKVSQQVSDPGQCMEHVEDDVIGLKTWHHGVGAMCSMQLEDECLAEQHEVV